MFLNKLLNHYIDRVFTEDSTLVRVLGVFQIQCVGNYSTSLFLMENVTSFQGVIAKYDIKGSTFGRRSKAPEILGKDLDFLETVGRLNIIPEDAEKLLKRLRDDGRILRDFGLMDYSLLITICRGKVPATANSNYVYRSAGGNEYYLIALIDFLQEYTPLRKFERYIKSKLHAVPSDEISVMEPQLYLERLVMFMEKVTLTINL
mmetsp:Transcript_24049/g.42738  ORF Transcript_24049/g.42738 Transcript_24049/m.42738 type:complete len:204 (+) Transcript_24049:168-779(+)